MSGLSFERIMRAAIDSMIRGHHAPFCYRAHVSGKGYVNEGDPATRADYLRQLERSATSEAENAGYARDYAEPGYTAGPKGIVLANWNVFPRELGDTLERAGYSVEWSDEWSTCDDCNRLVRTSADSYGWRASFKLVYGCEIVCKDCLLGDPEQYVTDCLLNREDTADTFDTDLAALGFTKVNRASYENGWHPGQDDSPEKVAASLPTDVDFVFAVPSVGQFDVRFDVWTRPKGLNK